MEGDVVAVRLLPRKRWRPAPAVIDTDDARDEKEDDDDAGTEETAEGSVSDSNNNSDAGVPCGRVVAVLSRAWKHYCGTIQTSEGESEVLFRCSDARIPRVRLRVAQPAALSGQLVVVGVDGWSRTALYPHGHYIRTLGPVGEHGPESDALLVRIML